MNSRAAFGFASTVSPQSEAGGRAPSPDVFNLFSQAYARERKEMMSLTDYLDACREDPSCYASAAERMIAAIGEPKIIDTSKDQRLGRIFLNRTIKLYPSMTGFFGMEDTIQRVVSFFQHAAQGLEERKQILYLLGPRRRRQVVARRAAEATDRIAADLCAGSRRRGQPDLRIARSGCFARSTMGAVPREDLQYPAAAFDRHLLALGGEAARSFRWRPVEVQRRQDLSLEAAPNLRREDRTGRRQQPGHLRAGRQSRHPQARAFLAARSRRLFLFGRPQSHDAGSA